MLQRSTDGGMTWGEPWTTQDLRESPPEGCHGSRGVVPPTTSLPGAAAAAEETTLYFGAPSSPSARAQLTLRRSDDGGKTWPGKLLLHDGPSAYSSMLLSLDGSSLAVLYERGDTPSSFFASRIAFARVELSEVDAAPLANPVRAIEWPR